MQSTPSMSVTSTIRIGTNDDLASVQRLIRTEIDSGAALPTIEDLDRGLGHQYLLVVDAPDGGIAAAAQVTLEGNRGHLGLLAVDHRFHGEGLEHRLLGVAEALCDAFGCETFDVSHPVRRDRGAHFAAG
jgi:GNAT superfamily N-acetyltransferase